MHWVGEAKCSRALVERRFELYCSKRRIPGVLWHPETAERSCPLVLIGHGASLHKRTGYVVSMARRFVRNSGFAAVAIDGPVHGDRRSDGVLDEERTNRDFLDVWGEDSLVDDMIEDWRATLDKVRGSTPFGNGPVGYWGVSMGTIFGLPLLVAEPRIRAAVLGLMGTIGPTAQRLAEDAARVTCPVLFLQQWDDELISRELGLELFDKIASRDKSLHIHPGAHSEIPLEEFTVSEKFLTRRLMAAAAASSDRTAES